MALVHLEIEYATPPTSGQVPIYNTAIAKWEPGSVGAASVDQTANYNWTGIHTWSQPITLNANSAQIVFDADSGISTTLQDSAATSSKVITLPNSTTTLAGLATTQTFTGTNTFNAQTIFQDPSIAGARFLGPMAVPWIAFSDNTTGFGQDGGTDVINVYNSSIETWVFSSSGHASLENIDMFNNLITNIGAAGTDFTSGGGLNLAGNLAVDTNVLLTDITNNTVGIATNPVAGAGKLKVGGALYCATEANAFGTSNPYTALIVDGGVDGGLYACGRANPVNEPFTGLSGWDSGTTRTLYFGGGGWNCPDATSCEFYAAPTYTETNDTGVLQLGIYSTGLQINNNAIFLQSTSSLGFRGASNIIIDSPALGAIRVNAQLGGQVRLTVGKVNEVSISTDNMTFEAALNPPNLNWTTAGVLLFNGFGTTFRMNAALQLQFRENAQAISSSSTNTLNITAGTTVLHQISAATEMTLTANRLTFNNGATTAYLGWATDGQLNIGMSGAGGGDEITIAVSSSTYKDGHNLVFNTTTGTKFGTATTQKLAFWNSAPIVQPSAYTQTYSTADKTLNAYTSDPESSAYTGIDNLQVGAVYAQVADLNTLRVAYENLRVLTEDAVAMLNSVVDDLQSVGLVG